MCELQPHPNVIQTFGCAKLSATCTLVLEHGGIELFEYIKSNGVFAGSLLRSVMLNMLDGTSASPLNPYNTSFPCTGNYLCDGHGNCSYDSTSRAQ